MKTIETYIVESLKKISAPVLELYKEPYTIEQKIDGTIVTEVDGLVEKLLQDQLSPKLRDAYFLGEEGSSVGGTDYSSVFNHEYLWAIDPIDGTVNFSNKIPLFAVSVGLLKRTEKGHKVVAGAALFPALYEIIYTDKGDSYRMNTLTEKSTKITPSNEEPSNKSVIAVTDSFNTDKKKYPYNLDRTKYKVQERNFGCAVFNAVSTATGSSFGTLTKAHLWDIAASIAIAKNLGVNLRNYNTGMRKDYFVIDDFVIGNPKKDWSLKELHVLCADNSYESLKEIIKQM